MFDEAKLRDMLTPMQYHVTQEKGTERPWSGDIVLDEKDAGSFACIVCDEAIFSSRHKFESGSGWPSFSDTIDSLDSQSSSSSKSKVHHILDNSYGMKRIEAVCASCGSHLGHVFDDGKTFAIFGNFRQNKERNLNIDKNKNI